MGGFVVNYVSVLNYEDLVMVTFPCVIVSSLPNYKTVCKTTPPTESQEISELLKIYHIGICTYWYLYFRKGSHNAKGDRVVTRLGYRNPQLRNRISIKMMRILQPCPYLC
jgi:hypothetical protein